MANQTLKHLKYDNKEIQVESAVRDGNGNTISSTYATKTELNPAIVMDNNGNVSSNYNDGQSINSIRVLEDSSRVFDDNQADIDTTYGAYGISVENADSGETVHLKFPYTKAVGTYTLTTTDDLNYLTTAPTAANTTGQIKIVILSSEPATKYDGYIYLITE